MYMQLMHHPHMCAPTNGSNNKYTLPPQSSSQKKNSQPEKHSQPLSVTWQVQVTLKAKLKWTTPENLLTINGYFERYTYHVR